MVIPKPMDAIKMSTIKQSAIGKAFVEFELITSAFTCYNILNNRNYLGKPVEINFFDNGLYITNSLK
jgi:hypothetical protein